MSIVICCSLDKFLEAAQDWLNGHLEEKHDQLDFIPSLKGFLTQSSHAKPFVQVTGILSFSADSFTTSTHRWLDWCVQDKPEFEAIAESYGRLSQAFINDESFLSERGLLLTGCLNDIGLPTEQPGE